MVIVDGSFKVLDAAGARGRDPANQTSGLGQRTQDIGALAVDYKLRFSMHQ